MPATISVEQRKKVLDLYASGMDPKKIAPKLRISESSVYSILDKGKAAVPDLQELRELGLSLKNAGISIEEAEEGADLLQRINRLNISLAMLSEAVSFYQNQTMRPDELIILDKRIKDLKTKYGKSIEEITSEAEEFSERRESLKKTISILENKIQDLQTQITCLEVLLALQTRLTKHGITTEEMDSFITRNQELQELGFTPGIAKIFATELAKYRLDKETAARTLASDIFGSKTLQESIINHRAEADKLEEENSRRKEENRVLKNQYETQLRQNDDAKFTYEKEERTRERTLEDLDSKIETAEKNLEKIASETSSIENKKASLASDLEQIEKIVDGNDYIKTITVLMAEPTIMLDWKAVERASVAFFDGFIRHIRANRNELFYATIVSSAITIRKILSDGARYDS